MSNRRRYLIWPFIGALLVLAAILRFWNLADKPFMHDESLFGYYSYSVYPLFNYRYEPILHGPLLLHLTALMFRIFGDSDFTARFWPAAFGTGCVLLTWLFRRGTGRIGALSAALMLCFSPTLLYYSRFMRNDMPLLFFALLLLLAFTRWYAREKSAMAAFFVPFSAGVMVCIKENAVFLFFTGVTFLLFAFIADLAQGFWRKRFNPLPRSTEDFLRFIYLAIGNCLFWIVIVLMGRRLFINPQTHESFTGISRNTVSVAILAGVALSQFLVWLLLEDHWGGIGAQRLGDIFIGRIRQTWMALLAGFLLSLALYCVLFTTWFKFKWGFFEIYRETLAYWWGQHQEHRLKGPFHYYMFRLLIYETLPLLIVMAGALIMFLRRWRLLSIFLVFQSLLVLATFLLLKRYPFDVVWADQHLHMTAAWHVFAAVMIAGAAICLALGALMEGQRLRAFCIWWTLFSILEYSYAGEKVPWLGVHLAAPLILWAGVEIEQFVLWLRQGTHLALKIPVTVALAILVVGLFMRHVDVALEVSFERPTDASEMLVYNHTMGSDAAGVQSGQTIEFLHIVRTIEEIAKSTGHGYQLPMSITGEAAWPLNWYLRRYDRYLTPENLASTDDIVIVANEDEIGKVPREFKEYDVKSVGLRQAWVPVPLSLQAMWKALIHPRSKDPVAEKGRRDWSYFRNYFLRREPWLASGEKNISVPYSVKFLVLRDAMTAPETRPER